MSSTWESIPALTADQMREVDRLMVTEFHITLEQMMENAGRALARLAVDTFRPETVLVLVGPGGNGGGGLVAARHLINSGRRVTVVLATTAERLGEVTAHQLDILRRMEADVTDRLPGPEHGGVALVIDALIGYSLTGAPRGRAAELIRWANDQPAPILSLDTPSGLDVTTGRAADPCVEATVTMTLALPKTGLRDAGQVGLLYLADISVLRAVYRKLGIEVGDDLFADVQIVAVSITKR